jgi:hypothetical protein
MKTASYVCAAAAALLFAPAARAQEPPKPGPEHEILKKMEGDWDLVMKFGGGESKGTVKYKTAVGATSSLSSRQVEQAFRGRL